MIRRTILSLIAVLLCCSTNAQVAKWMLKPDYDAISINNVGLLEVRKDNKVGLFDRNGNELVAIDYDSIDPFCEGYAMLYKNGKFVGFTNEDGKIVDLSTSGYQLKEGADTFSCGRLLVYKIENNKEIYRFLNTNGYSIGGVYSMAYPFFEGYASVETYPTDKNGEEIFPDMINIDGVPVTFPDEKKSNLQFISSFRDGVAIVILKGKFYTVYPYDFTLQPMHTDSLMNRKSAITLESSTVIKRRLDKDNTLLKARNANFVFNKYNQLSEYKYENNEAVKLLDKESEPRTTPNSKFEAFREGQLYGLLYNENKLLPAQFEKVTAVEDHFAIVCSNGKYGIVTIDNNSQFKLIINDYEDVPFRHSSQKIKLKALLPTWINEAFIESCGSDCRLYDDTYTPSRNTLGYYLAYEGTLTIPSDLTSTPTEYIHNFQLSYDGLKSEVICVPVIEWYSAYHYVNIKTGSMQVDPNNNTITIEFEVLKNETVYDTRTYSHDVKVYQVDRHGAQTLIDHREINNTLYTFSLEHKEITQAVTNFEIHITETGCPAIIHPFIIRFNISGGDDDKNKTVTATVEATKHKSTSDQEKEEEGEEAEDDDLEMTNDYDKILSNMAN